MHYSAILCCKVIIFRGSIVLHDSVYVFPDETIIVKKKQYKPKTRPALEFAEYVSVVHIVIEPRHEKTCLLHMRKTRA